MNISIHSPRFEVTAALAEHTIKAIERAALAGEGATGVQVHLEMAHDTFTAKATTSEYGRALHAEASGSDMYAVIDALAEKLARQYTKAKDKAQDHAAIASKRLAA